MISYHDFLSLNLDLAPLGLEQGESHSDYFCTPVGATVLGWAGVDGIHYCLVPGFGETVFAVSPMNTPADHVHPIAANLEDLLRLLLSCSGMAALEQVHMWDRGTFTAFLWENPPTEPQKNSLAHIAQVTHLEPMEDPYGYLSALQASFDYSAIPFSEEYYDEIPTNRPTQPWEVRFEGSSREKPGREVRLDHYFTWAGEPWCIPAVYICSKGLVVELCRSAPPQAVLEFAQRMETAYSGADDEEQSYIMSLHPLNTDITATAVVNGRSLHWTHGQGETWFPPAYLDPELHENQNGRRAVEHYGLPMDRAWAFMRISFPWATARAPKLRSLTVTLEADAVPVLGETFSVSAVGDSFPFRHPITGREHIFTVTEFSPQTLDLSALHESGMEYPAHCHLLGYTVTPELEKSEMRIRDCSRTDSPRPCESAEGAACSIGVIGGADGPTAVFAAPRKTMPRAIYSSLHFIPQPLVLWRMIFPAKPREDMTLTLMGPCA